MHFTHAEMTSTGSPIPEIGAYQPQQDVKADNFPMLVDPLHDQSKIFYGYSNSNEGAQSSDLPVSDFFSGSCSNELSGGYTVQYQFKFDHVVAVLKNSYGVVKATTKYPGLSQAIAGTEKLHFSITGAVKKAQKAKRFDVHARWNNTKKERTRWINHARAEKREALLDDSSYYLENPTPITFSKVLQSSRYENARDRRRASRIIEVEGMIDNVMSTISNGELFNNIDSLCNTLERSVEERFPHYMDIAFTLHDYALFAYSIYKANDLAQLAYLVRGTSRGVLNLVKTYTAAGILWSFKQAFKSAKKEDKIAVEGFFDDVTKYVANNRPSSYLKWLIEGTTMMFSSEFAKIVRDFMLTCISLKVFKNVPPRELLDVLSIDKKDVKEAENVSAFGVCMSAVKSFASISALLESWFLGEIPMSFFFTKNPVVVALAEVPLLVKQSEYLYMGLPITGYVDVTSWYTRAKEVYAVIEKASANSTPFSYRGTEIIKARIELGAVIANVASRRAAERRITPFGIILHSHPGVGKSGILDFLAAIMSQVKNRKHHAGLMYHRNMSSDYMESLQTMSQPYYHYSELGKLKEQIAITREEPGIAEFLSLCDSQPMEVNKAFGDKGKQFACPELVIADTNNETFNVEAIAHAPSAFFRRFLFIKVSVKHEFRKLDGRSCEIDYKKGKDHPLLDKWWFDVYTYVAIDNKERSEPQYLLRRGDIHDLYDTVHTMFSDHITNTSEFERRLAVELDEMKFGKNRYGKTPEQTIDELEQSIRKSEPLADVNHEFAYSNLDYDEKYDPENNFIVTEGKDDSVEVKFDQAAYTRQMMAKIQEAQTKWENLDENERIRITLEELDRKKRAKEFKIVRNVKDTVDYLGMEALLVKESFSNFAKGSIELSSHLSSLAFMQFKMILAEREYKRRFFYFYPLLILLFVFSFPFGLFFDNALIRSFFSVLNTIAIIGVVSWYSFVKPSLNELYRMRRRLMQQKQESAYLWCRFKSLFGYVTLDANGDEIDMRTTPKQTFYILMGFGTLASIYALFSYLYPKVCALFSDEDRRKRAECADRDVTLQPVSIPSSVTLHFPSVDEKIDPQGTSLSKDSGVSLVQGLMHCGGQTHQIAINSNVAVWNTMQPVLGLVHTGDFDSLYKGIIRNIRKVEIFSGDTFIMRMHLFGLKGDIAVIPKHAFPAKYSDFLLKVPLNGENLKLGWHEIRLNKMDIFSVGEELVMFRAASLKFKDITKHIVAERVKFTATVNAAIGNEKVLVSYDDTPRLYGTSTENSVITESYSYLWEEHANGKCGFPLFGQFQKTSGVFGIHFGTINGGKSFSAPLSRDMIAKFEKVTEADLLFPIASEGEKAPTIPFVHSKSPFRYEEFGIVHMGSLPSHPGSSQPASVNINKSSKLSKSIIHEHVDEIFDPYFGEEKTAYGPPTFKPFLNSAGEWISPYNKGLRKMSKQRFAVSRVLLRRVIKSLSDHIVSGLKAEGISLKPYGIDYAINGDPHNPNFRRMNASTAPGYGWTGVKGDHFPIESTDHPIFGVYAKPTPKLVSAVESLLSTWSKGETADCRYNVALKDEARSVEKCKNGSTRLFYVQSVDSVVAMRMLYGSFFSLFPSHQELFHCAVGINMHTESDRLWKSFLSFDGFAGDFDYEGFDVSGCPDVTWAAMSCIHDIMFKLGYPREMKTILESCATELLSPVLVMLGEVMTVAGLQPSGMYATAELNSFKNTIMLMLCWYSSETLSKFDFFTDFFHYTYGDDVFYKVSPQASIGFNNCIYAKFCKDTFNMNVTTASKSHDMPPFTEVNDISFLKRKFVLREDLGIFVGQLDSDSIRKSLKWHLPSDSVTSQDQMLSTIRSALYEIYFHLDRDQFWSFRDAIISAFCDGCGVSDANFRAKISKKLPTFDSIKSGFENADFPLMDPDGI